MKRTGAEDRGYGFWANRPFSSDAPTPYGSWCRALRFPSHVDSPIGEANFLANLHIDVPPRSNDAGRDELGANVTLTERFLVHAARA